MGTILERERNTVRAALLQQVFITNPCALSAPEVTAGDPIRINDMIMTNFLHGVSYHLCDHPCYPWRRYVSFAKTSIHKTKNWMHERAALSCMPFSFKWALHLERKLKTEIRSSPRLFAPYVCGGICFLALANAQETFAFDRPGQLLSS